MKLEQTVASWMKDNYTPEVQARVFGRYFSDVDKLRTSETPDREWGAKVEQEIRKLLENTNELGQGALEQIACGATLCRMKFSVENARQRDKLLRSIQHALRFDESSAHIPSGSNSAEAVFSREGATLPPFDQVQYVSEEMN